MRRGAELDEGTAIEREEDCIATELVALRMGAALDDDPIGAGELVGTPTCCDEVSTTAELVLLRKTPCEDCVGMGAEPEACADEVLTPTGAVPDMEMVTGREDDGC